MAVKPFIKVEVLNQSDKKTAQALARINQEFDRQLGGIVVQTADNIVRDTLKSGFPFITGTLKRSYAADTRGAKKSHEAYVGSDIDYAPNVEFGIGQIAQPYFEPAVDEHESNFNEALEKLIKKYAK